MRNSGLALVGMAVVGACFMSSQAKAVTLPTPISNLTGGATFSEGATTFSAWTYTPAGADAPAATDVVVNAFPSTERGVIFASDWEADSTGSATSFGDSSITYEASASTNTFIKAVDLDFAATAAGDSSATVLETVIDLDHNLSYSLAVSTKAGFSASETLAIAPTQHLKLIKDILVKAGSHGAAGDAVISTVENSFHTAVPEPMSLALLPLALAGLGLRKKLA